MKRPYTYIIFILAILLSSCEKNKNDIYRYYPPENIGDGIEISTLSEEGLDERKFIEMMEEVIAEHSSRIHSILVLKNDKLVFEEYFEGYALSNDPYGSDGEWMTYNRETDHYLASISKSITSILVGIAIDKGYIYSESDKVVDYLPAYSDILTGDKAEITIEHMLTMTSGFPWDESTYPIGHELNDHTYLFNADDPIRWVLERPLEYAPGERWKYNSGTTNVLAAIVEESSGFTFEEFLDSNLFEPLGIENEDYLIIRFSNGRTFASGGFYMSARELGKIGLLYLNEGMWNGNRIVSAEWVEKSHDAHVIFTGTYPFIDSYGYQWWRNSFDVDQTEHYAYFGLGWGEQVLFIFPVENMVVLFYCGYFQVEPQTYPADLVEKYILPSLISK
jgi:CubicO group peptidase (beta-lactamase class C family)